MSDLSGDDTHTDEGCDRTILIGQQHSNQVRRSVIISRVHKCAATLSWIRSTEDDCGQRG